MKTTPFFSQSINPFVLIATSLTLVLNTALSIDPQFLACNPTRCGNISIKFPFYIENQQQSYCGFPGFGISCINNTNTNPQPVINLSNSNYTIHEIFYQNRSFRVSIQEPSFFNCSKPQVQVQNQSLNPERFRLSSEKRQLLLLYNCNKNDSRSLKYEVDDCVGDGNVTLAMFGDDPLFVNASNECGSRVVIPADEYIRDDVNVTGIDLIREVVERGFLLNWTASDCGRCARSGGKCGFDYPTYQFRCFCPDRPHAWQCQPDKQLSGWKLGIVIGIASAVVVMILLSIYVLRHHYKWKYDPSRFVKTDSSLNELETGSIYFGIPIFSYSELEEATDRFESAKELGDGGFGTVYYGKLKDGREVAVKRLYEHNYRRHEQFMNEVEILTRLRHKNLVSLYGCTSHRSRALLLVYEYVSNGTVADHLYGDRSKSNLLTWPIRMSIAIETATALAYLHASDIIHRDVKTTNILLDNKLSVKVADFGLSRLFPTDVTHVTTAPQGTPGYVDPEYHKCYQLTDKSDVYSFGVVLIELISSMPAVDITRSKDEINLAYLAINRIQKRDFDELIDSSLGYKDDEEVTRMTTSIAELAFQCLQQDKDARPSMKDVLDELKRIAGVESKEDSTPTPEIEADALLKGKIPFSPDTVTAKWTSSSSCSTTVNASSVNR